MFNRPDSENRTKLEETFNRLESPLQQATENQLSYALFKGGLGKLEPLKNVKLLGYEIPLAEDSEGQLKVDLFGISSAGDAIEIIEIKKAENYGDSPLFALAEAICYALQTLRSMDFVVKETEGKISKDAFRKINLKIVAPAGYWKYWGYSLEIVADREAIRTSFEKILGHVNAGIAAADGPHAELTLELLELRAHGEFPVA